MEYSLIRHPSSPVPPIDSIGVDVSRLADNRLVLRYRVEGDIRSLAIAPLMAAERVDGLWDTTCFEAFLRKPDIELYAEFNFSPSTRWAGYLFRGYRGEREDFPNPTMPRIDLEVGVDSFELRATIDISGNQENWRTSDLHLGLSAVIETRDRQKSYWALAHNKDVPDFHDWDCFTGILRAPDPA